MPNRVRFFAILILCLAARFSLAADIALEQIISREHPAFKCEDAQLTVGRDGVAYLSNTIVGDSFILRVKPDGSNKVGGTTNSALHNATANANEIIGTANAHFMRSLFILNGQLEKIASVPDFLGNDAVGWDAPAHVEAGETSGDFYVLDQHRDRIVRATPAGNVTHAIALPATPPKTPAMDDFRVCEKAQMIVALNYHGTMVCVGFDGKEKWELKPSGISNNNGGFDLDAGGNVYLIGPRDSKIRVLGAADGKQMRVIDLKMGELSATAPTAAPISELRFAGPNDVLIKRRHPTEIFARYDLTTGALKNVVTADHERLGITFASDIWTAGQPLAFKIDFSAGEGRRVEPRWHVWARPFGTIDYRELKLDGGQLQVPADLAGIYQIKVTPELDPWQRGLASEYKIETAVEVRAPGAKGTIAVLTPSNRSSFGRGETIPISILARTGERKDPLAITLRLMQGDRAIAESKQTLDAKVNSIDAAIASSLTASLAPGNYTLAVSAGADSGFTCINKPILIGPGVREPAFHTIEYGDYGLLAPTTKDFDAPDLIANHVERTTRLGFNMIVERVGDPNHNSEIGWYNGAFSSLDAFAKRIEADPTAAPVALMRPAPAGVQAMAGYSADGIQHMSILMRNDAGLPIDQGLPYDGRKPEEILKRLNLVTELFKPFPAFRGWVWASNWWVWKRGADAARSDDEKKAYAAALKVAHDTGKWDPVLDALSDYRLSFAPTAQALFGQTLKKLAPNAITASAAPFRHVDSYPPISFANVDETDLQAQWEQIAIPFASAINVDFYKRPGKRAWGHPEIWNDDGTGGQIVPTLFQMLMRGADGVGPSGHLPNWGITTADSRTGYPGLLSVYRSLNVLLNRYGNWMANLQNNDAVAIIADGRMFRIDDWQGNTGQHFARVFEAYVSCLAAHQPASIVFTEDASAEVLRKFKAILLIDQRVEIEPKLLDALKAAQASGVAILRDKTCRDENVQGFKPLAIAFDEFEKDPSSAGDDSAYWRFSANARANVPALSEALNAIAKPSATTDSDEVMLSERKSEDGRYVFVVNNTQPDLDPGLLWRMTLSITSRVPMIVPVKLSGTEGKFVYDVFAAKQVKPDADGTVQADLRTLPARLYAILPAPVAIQLVGPNSIRAGSAFEWTLTSINGQGPSVHASIPMRLRLIDDAGGVIDEQHLSVGSAGVKGTSTAPLTAPKQLRLEATELLTNVISEMPINVQPAELPLAKFESAATVADGQKRVGDLVRKPSISADSLFGPHLRDIAISGDEKLAVVNAMNWDHNLYAIDLSSGETKWRQRVGDYFAFAPQFVGNTLAVQSFDFRSAEGYSLDYLGAGDGKTERRFALYGLPVRLPHRFVPALIADHINNFAAAPDGSWVASSGDLGLAVFSRDGKILWQQDWWKTQRHEARLAAIDAQTLLVAEGITLSAYDAKNGSRRWQQTLATGGDVREIRLSKDGKTIAILATTEGGRVFVLRDGKIIATIPTAGEEIDLSADGSTIAVVSTNLLKLYSVETGLRWTFSADDRLHDPRFAPDNHRVAVGSEMGTLYVLDRDSDRVLLQRDMLAWPIPAWLSGGDLLVGTWMGDVVRLDASFKESWRTKLAPTATDMRGKLLTATADPAPLARVESWGNASADPVDTSKNLLAQTNAIVKFVPSSSWGGVAQFQLDPKLLFDGKPDAPPDTWLPWNSVGFFAEGSPINYILIDTFHTRLRVDAITFVEDPKHPESWLRDATLEVWDMSRAEWKKVQPLLSDSQVHTHKLATPVEGSRFRIMLPKGLVGNLRLGEIMLSGEILGPAHPDAAAKKPVAVLFDEVFYFKDQTMVQAGGQYQTASPLKLSDAYSGGACLALPADGALFPNFTPPFGHEFPGFEFEIAENPQPGQYRYLQFAMKGTPQTKGMTLELTGSPPTGGGGLSINLTAGEAAKEPATATAKVADTPPTEWTVYRVDLWKTLNRPMTIRGMRLYTSGGAGAWDQILLGKTEDVLPTKQ